MRIREPDTTGTVEVGGVRIAYETFGGSGPGFVLLPTWPIVHGRVWKAQVPYLARRHRVVVFDPRGNGASDRPTDPAAYGDDRWLADLFAVMDAAALGRAVLVGFCSGVRWALEAADVAPERVLGVVTIAAGMPHLVDPDGPDAAAPPCEPPPASWHAAMDPASWRDDFPAFVEAHAGPLYMTPEPFSSKLREDLVAWGMEASPDALLATLERPVVPPMPIDRAEAEALLRRIDRPVLAIAGTLDRCQGVERSRRVAELTRGELVVLEGAGHAMIGRHPVTINRLLAGFAARVAGPDAPPRPRRWVRSLLRPPQALFVSSPIGLGHARRDLAIARALRALRPELRISWLTQHPVTRFLEAHGERVHPASHELANESRHIEGSAVGHELNVFESIRQMDEILVANFMVFHDLVREEPFDLVIGDEAWEVDKFLHEHPELKRSPLAWLTDFVGWLPMPEGGAREAELAAEANADTIAHVERFPSVRDRAIYVGDPDDVIDASFGAGLPDIRPWVEEHYDFAGYVSSFGTEDLADADATRAAVRSEFGYGDDEVVCVVAVGGSGVGASLLRRVVDAFPLAKRLQPALRLVAVTGPRIDPHAFAPAEGLELHGYVKDLHRLFVACDAAVVQGGLSTTMELVAARRPFAYVPLRRHFEQNLHVRHRLRRYRAGLHLPYDEATPERLAETIATLADRPVRSRRVAPGGAERAAGLIAELL